MEIYVNTHDIPKDLLTKDLPSWTKNNAFYCMLFCHSTAEMVLPCDLVAESSKSCQEVD